MTFKYPYESKILADSSGLQKGIDYSIWQSDVTLKDHLAKLDGPIIEIGGPSDGGFFFLNDVDLHSKPVITNISPEPILPMYDKNNELADQVSGIMDATKMPYKDESIAIFLMSNMSISSDWWVNLSDDEKAKAAVKFENEFTIAKLETEQIALGLMKPEKAVHAQRVQIYQEVYRTLCKGGLLFSNGQQEDIDILKIMGFELVAVLQCPKQASDDPQDFYEFVVAKNS